MTSIIQNVAFDCADPYQLALFWSEVTGQPLSDEDHPGDPEASIPLPGGPTMFFNRVPEGKVAEPRTGRRIHLDVMPVDRTRDEEVEWLKGIGATEFEDHREADGTGWVTMADPEGNLFCVERSAGERVRGSAGLI